MVKKATACAACLMLDGEVFALEDELNDHPRGKCTAIPIVDGVTPPQWQKGKDWFLEQDEAKQKEILGASKWQLWQDGGFELEQLAQHTHSNVWGSSPRVATMKELIKVSVDLDEKTLKYYSPQKSGKPIEDIAYRYGEHRNGLNGVTFFSKEKDYAEEYAIELGGGADAVKEYNVFIKNPLFIVVENQRDFANAAFENSIIKDAIKNDFDGVVFENEIGTFYVEISRKAKE